MRTFVSRTADGTNAETPRGSTAVSAPPAPFRFGRDFGLPPTSSTDSQERLSTSPIQVARQVDESTLGPAAPSPSATGGAAATPATPGPANPLPGCSPSGLSRQDFLAQAGDNTLFGLTKLEVVMDATKTALPQLQFTAVRGGVTLRPTTAALPPIPSIYTDAGTFTEGTAPVVGPGACPEGQYPLRWTITASGAQKIREGEQEHCDDFNRAFDLSAGRYRDVINQLASSGHVFRSEDAARRRLKSQVGFAYDDLPGVFACLVRSTKVRDHRGWHTPRPHSTPPIGSRCDFSRAVIDSAGLQQVGPHSSTEVVRGCGETPAPRSRPGRGNGSGDGPPQTRHRGGEHTRE